MSLFVFVICKRLQYKRLKGIKKRWSLTPISEKADIIIRARQNGKFIKDDIDFTNKKVIEELSRFF